MVFDPSDSVTLRTPIFMNDAIHIHSILQKLRVPDLQLLMAISQNIANNTAEIIHTFHTAQSKSSAAIYAYRGDVYQGLHAQSLDTNDLSWADAHVCILSALYGVLHPLDSIHPYRLEMKTKLPVGQYKDLVAYWQQKISNYLLEKVGQDENDFIVNLTSQEYNKAIKLPKSFQNIFDIQFYEEDEKGERKIVSAFAKKARGLYARWMIKNRIESTIQLAEFNAEGYIYRPELSSGNALTFTRKKMRQ